MNKSIIFQFSRKSILSAELCWAYFITRNRIYLPDVCSEESHHVLQHLLLFFCIRYILMTQVKCRIISIVHPWCHHHRWTMEMIQHFRHEIDKNNRNIKTCVIMKLFTCVEENIACNILLHMLIISLSHSQTTKSW